MNQLCIVGRALGAPKLSDGAKPRAQVTIAVRDPFGKKQDNGYPEDTLVSCTWWGEAAAAAVKVIGKGDMVEASGRAGCYLGQDKAVLSLSVNSWSKIWTGAGTKKSVQQEDPFAE